jgi:cell division protein FtsI/penicillin-binding protein 2
MHCSVAFQFCRRMTGSVILLVALASSRGLRAAEGLPGFVARAMQGKAGAVIVSDPRTGQVLALWNQQAGFEQAYAPGSTAKLVVSAAALEEGIITPSDKILCRRVPRLLGEGYHCSHSPASTPFDLAAALSNSCNYFFSEVSARISSPALAHWYAAFGFGSAGESASPGEVNIADDPKARALVALGEQGVTATPARVLQAYSAVATGGQIYRLILPGQHEAPTIDRVVQLKPETLAVLAKGLRDCVRSGTCKAAAVPGVAVAGKTGTAPALDGSHATRAWFVGYAPANAPQVAIVVFLLRGTGGGNAAPIAAQILERYFAPGQRTP